MIYRGYLSHWALFLLEESSGLENFLDLVYDEKYFSLIEHSFDYLIKYLIIFTIISKSKQKIDILLSTLNKLVIDSTHPLANYVKLFDLVYNEYDYEGSVDVMNLCAEDMQRDYFAYKYIGLFKEKVKETILENYIRLNSTVDLK